jgi:superoxide dismutase
MLRPRLPRIALNLRRRVHTVPPLQHFEDGIPGLLSKEGFDTAYTQYQYMLTEKLNRFTAGM